MNNIDFSLSQDQILEYREQGVIRISLPPAQRNLLKSFRRECCVWLKTFGGWKIDDEELALRLPEIAQQDRALISKLYKISRRFPSVKQLASDPWLSKVSADLMGTMFSACCHFTNVRIDLPGEDKYLLPPHQDFPYIQGSQNGVTWWVPFTDAPPEVGPPTFIPGTHKLGVLKVREFDYEKTGGNGGMSFSIDDDSALKGVGYAPSLHVKFGEAMIFHTLLVHRSEPNNSSIARLNTQIRFSDPMLIDSFERNYPEGLYLRDAFSKSYPEFVSVV
jgi:hypothetical protein